MPSYTTVTGQVLDPEGNAYSNGSFSITLVLPASVSEYPAFIGGGFIPGVIAGGALDANGNLPTLSLPDNAQITPPGTKWQFNILNSTSRIGFSAQLTITGVSQVVTTALQDAAAPLAAPALGTATGFGVTLGPATRPDGAQSYLVGIRDGGGSASGLMTGGAAEKTYAFGIVVNRPASADASGDSNDAIAKWTYNNYGQCDTNFILRGLNSVVNNRSAGTLGQLIGGLISASSKSGSVTPTVRGAEIQTENFGTNATEHGGLDVAIKNEGAKATVQYGVRIRNIDQSNIAAADAALLIPVNSGNTVGWTYGIDFNGATIGTADIRFSNGVILKKSGSQAYDGITVSRTITADPSGADSTALFVENNRQDTTNNVATITAVEGVVRSRGADEAMTIRGGHFRTYIDETYTATARTSVGLDASVRASGAVVAESGTAFVGVRSYMAPGFTVGSVGNINNHHAFWAYNEHATNAVTNAFYLSDGGGGFTNGINLSGGNVTNDIVFSNSVTLKKKGTDTWDGITITKTTSAAPDVGADGVALFVENNKTSASANVCAITAVEGAARARADGDETTLRGGHFRTYIDDTLSGTAITSVGVDAAPRASGAVVADAGTAFVGVRAYMAPGFTGGTLANVTNFHAFWGYNESATQAVTNLLYASDAGGGFTNGINLGSTTPLTKEIIFSNSMELVRSGANAWDGLKLTKSTVTGPTTGNEGVALFIENNRTAIIDDQATVTAVEGAARSRSSGVNLTVRGGHFRVYVDQTLGGTAITSVGLDGAVRGSGSVVAAPGTAFVGIRSYMSPGFTGGSVGNVTNFHAFWAYNESTTQAVTNAFYASSAAGGFTNGLNLSGATIAAGGGQVVFSNGVVFYTGSQVTRNAVRTEVGTGGAVGSKYFSTGGREYLKVAIAGADTDWERVTTSVAD